MTPWSRQWLAEEQDRRRWATHGQRRGSWSVAEGEARPGALTRDDWVHSVHEDLSVRMRPAYLNKYIPHTINTEFDRFQEKQ